MIKAINKVCVLAIVLSGAARPALAQDGAGQGAHANGACWTSSAGAFCQVDGRAVALSSPDAARGDLVVVPSAPVPAEPGAAGGQDQLRWRAAMAAIGSSKSSAPTGTFDFTAYQNGALIEPGIYDAGGLTFGAGALRLRARIPGTVVIRIPRDQYFMTLTDKVESTSVDGIIFVGGQGGFHYTYGRFNVAGMQNFTNNLFWGYKQAAIANEAPDMPYFHIRDNIFYGTPSSIGVAIGGDQAGTVIESNAFLLDAYHLAIGPNFNGFINILRNDFIAFGNNIKKADIWFKPGAVAGVTIEGNKFGSENNPPSTPRILIANENTASGPDRASRRPSTTDATGTLRGMTIVNNITGESSRPTGAFLQSYIRDVQAISWRRNRFAGNPYDSIVNFANGVAQGYTGVDSDFEFQRADVTQPSRPAARFSNVTFARLRDYGGFWPGDPNAVEVYPVSDDPTFALMLNGLTSRGRSSLGRVTRASAPDPAGHKDFETVTVPALRMGEYASFSGAAAGGRYTLEMWLARAPSRSLNQMRVDVFNYRSNQVALSYDLTLPATAGRFSVPFYLPPDNNPEGWQLRVYPLQDLAPGASDSFQTGWWLVNSGWGRMGRERAAALTPASSH